jgi:hypothetical protein
MTTNVLYFGLTFLIVLLATVFVARLSVVKIFDACVSRTHKPLVVINSHAQGDADVLLQQLVQAGFKKTQILVVIGNSNCNSITMKDTHVRVDVDHNSFDFNAFIACIEHKHEIDRLLGYSMEAFLYLHDTCRIGNRFHELLIRKFSLTTVRLVSDILSPLVKSCNLGMYAFDDLLSVKQHIIQKKRFPMTQKERSQVKREHFLIEDMIFDTIKTKKAFQYMFVPCGRLEGRNKLFVSALDVVKLQEHGSLETIGIPIRWGKDTHAS